MDKYLKNYKFDFELRTLKFTEKKRERLENGKSNHHNTSKT